MKNFPNPTSCLYAAEEPKCNLPYKITICRSLDPNFGFNKYFAGFKCLIIICLCVHFGRGVDFGYNMKLIMGGGKLQFVINLNIYLPVCYNI